MKKETIEELEYMEEAVALGVVGEASKEVKFGVSNSVRQYNLLTNKINELIEAVNKLKS